ncbi:MAG TPA: DUF2905 domain-containing protein [Anaeromyxobacter sp.]|nr:DUF2905 domain-containing protein [Anaeromyxobacter sp.]
MPLVTGVGALGKLLLAVGLSTAALGGILLLADRVPWLRLGRLPGDLSVERPGFRLYFPLATSLLVSAALTLVLWLLSRRR